MCLNVPRPRVVRSRRDPVCASCVDAFVAMGTVCPTFMTYHHQHGSETVLVAVFMIMKRETICHVSILTTYQNWLLSDIV